VKMRRLEKVLLNSPLRTWILRRRVDQDVLRRLDLPPGGTCLEIGCGKGVGALLIARRFQPARLVCLDLDPDMIRAAERYLARPPRWARDVDTAPIELACGDATHLPFDDETFDAAFLFGALHHISDWPAVLRETARTLKPTGPFAFEEALIGSSCLYLNRFWGHVPFGAADLEAALHAAGLRLEALRQSCAGRYCAGLARKTA
jgi:ubiquinone/menaquinone biosynthesis C-methylase UbiE